MIPRGELTVIEVYQSKTLLSPSLEWLNKQTSLIKKKVGQGALVTVGVTALSWKRHVMCKAKVFMVLHSEQQIKHAWAWLRKFYCQCLRNSGTSCTF